MTEPGASTSQFSLRTVWARRLETPLREFLRTESGSAAVLVAATWPRSSGPTSTRRGTRRRGTPAPDPVRHQGPGRYLRTWVNSGLMTFFFLVVGLEARREFDLGELRERRRLRPAVGAPAWPGWSSRSLIYLAINPGGTSAHGWGTAMSTDTALALGAARRARSRRAGPGAGLPAHRVRGRRHRGPGSWSSPSPTASDDRARPRCCSRSPCCSARPGGLRCGLAAAARLYLLLGVGVLGRAGSQRRRPGGGRPGDRADGAAYSPSRVDLEEATGLVPALPRAADRRSWPGRRAAG